MSYIAWDTETTGLPMSRTQATPENVDNFKFCRLVSLALVKYTSSGREVGSYHQIAYPDGFEVKLRRFMESHTTAQKPKVYHSLKYIIHSSNTLKG